jgi:hypothetical protein
MNIKHLKNLGCKGASADEAWWSHSSNKSTKPGIRDPHLRILLAGYQRDCQTEIQATRNDSDPKPGAESRAAYRPPVVDFEGGTTGITNSMKDLEALTAEGHSRAAV